MFIKRFQDSSNVEIKATQNIKIFVNNNLYKKLQTSNNMYFKHLSPHHLAC